MFFAVASTIALLSGSLAVLMVGLVLLVGMLSECSFSFHVERKAEKPLALPDYSRTAWYSLESPYKTVITTALPHCKQCGHPQEEDASLFCGQCGHPSGDLHA